MTAYYNEFDPKAAAWLRELIADGLIAAGDVDERSIVDVQGSDLEGYSQCHFFSGIGGWSYALRLAGWPDDAPVWTGSCPCQPYSVAGKQNGADDARHLWPHMARLVRECRPPVVFGEQVAHAIRLGWLDGVFTDLEAAGYACGAAVLGAHSVGAPHIRQRLYWVADSDGGESGIRSLQRGGEHGQQQEDGCGVRFAYTQRPYEGMRESGVQGQPAELGRDRLADSGTGVRMADASCGGLGIDGCTSRETGHTEQCEPCGGMGDTRCTGLAGRTEQSAREERQTAERTGHWSDSIWHACRDGKSRRIPAESLFQFTSDGLSYLMGSSWNRCILELKEEIVNYAKESKAGPCQVLFEVWEAVSSQEVLRNARGYDAIPSPELLLLAMCELARRSQSEFIISAQNIERLQEETLRVLRSIQPSTCSSSQRKLARSQIGKSSESVHKVPSWRAQQKGEEDVFSLPVRIEETWNVPKALSAMEKVWRSFLDKEKKAGNAERLRDCASIIIATNRFPLSGFVPGRLGILRGAGNAIVPQVAAAFVKAYMDSRRVLGEVGR